MRKKYNGLRRVVDRLDEFKGGRVVVGIGGFLGNFFRAYDKYNYYFFRFFGLHLLRVWLANLRILIGRRLILRRPGDCYTELCNKGVYVRKDVFTHEELQSLNKLIFQIESGSKVIGRTFRQDGGAYYLVNLGEALHLSIPPDIVSDVSFYLGVDNLSDVVLWLHGIEDDSESPIADINYIYHTDTYHHTVKGFLYVNPLREADGPFNYITGSNKLTFKRVWFEFRNSCRILGTQGFRAEDFGNVYPGSEEVTFQNLGNAFIVADTFGFHRRGLRSSPGKRWAVYFSARINPFRFKGHCTS